MRILRTLLRERLTPQRRRVVDAMDRRACSPSPLLPSRSTTRWNGSVRRDPVGRLRGDLHLHPRAGTSCAWPSSRSDGNASRHARCCGGRPPRRAVRTGGEASSCRQGAHEPLRRGLSGARNTGLESACGEVIVFLDDDAAADEDWLQHLLAPYAQPTVIGVGGLVVPNWSSGPPPWFPAEFGWVVGCSYEGLPVRLESVRNPIGANMSFRRKPLAAANGFETTVGRVGTRPVGCEETEAAIRLCRRHPEAMIMHQPARSCTTSSRPNERAGDTFASAAGPNAFPRPNRPTGRSPSGTAIRNPVRDADHSPRRGPRHPRGGTTSRSRWARSCGCLPRRRGGHG